MNENEEMNSIINIQANIIHNVMNAVALLCSLIVLLIDIFRFRIMEILTPFIAPLVELIGYFIFTCSLLLTLVYFVVSKMKMKKKVVPLSINIVALLLIITVPFTSLTLDWDFRHNKSQREAVVAMLADETLDASGRVVSLPDSYKQLSRGGGDIIVVRNDNQLQVLFFTYRGVTDNYAGFVYTNNDEAPDEQMFGQFIELVKLDQHWYWVSST